MPIHSMEMRERVWEALQQGASSLEVAERFDVAASWVRSLRQAFRRRGHLTPVRPVGRRRQVSEAGEAQLRQWVQHEPELTLKQLAERLKATVGRLLSEATMSRLMKRLGITKKKDVWQLRNVTRTASKKRGKFSLRAGSMRVSDE